MNIAIIGSGPSAFYTIQSLFKEGIKVDIDIFEKLPAPYGLVRYGVAPDHQKTKNIIKLFSKYLFNKNVKYFGNIEVGKDIKIEHMSDLYDAVIIATGAPEDNKLNIEGSDLSNIFGSTEFVGWYNGVPKYSELAPNFNHKNAIIIGNGNVALDCARILSKTKEEFYDSDIMNYSIKMLQASLIENIYVIGRRTPRDAKFTIAELRELSNLGSFQPVVDYPLNELKSILEQSDTDTKIKKNVEVLLNFKEKKEQVIKKIKFKFLKTPFKIERSESEYSFFFKNNIIKNNKIIVTDEIQFIRAGLIISAIGYKVTPINDIPLDISKSYFLNKEGHIKDNIYTNGWASGSSVGVIGSNKAGGATLAKKIINEIVPTKKDSTKKLLTFLRDKEIQFINKNNWEKIDQIELNEVSKNFIRNKLVDINYIFSRLSK